MNLTLLKGKIHRATVTHAELHYEGSCAIDEHLLEAANIREFEQIDIYNVTNGKRLTTYAIRGERGSGVISLNGAAAHCAEPGDLVIICAYAGYSEAEAAQHKPSLVYADENNGIAHAKNSIPVQAA